MLEYFSFDKTKCQYLCHEMKGPFCANIERVGNSFGCQRDKKGLSNVQTKELRCKEYIYLYRVINLTLNLAILLATTNQRRESRKILFCDWLQSKVRQW